MMLLLLLLWSFSLSAVAEFFWLSVVMSHVVLVCWLVPKQEPAKVPFHLVLQSDPCCHRVCCFSPRIPCHHLLPCEGLPWKIIIFTNSLRSGKRGEIWRCSPDLSPHLWRLLLTPHLISQHAVKWEKRWGANNFWWVFTHYAHRTRKPKLKSCARLWIYSTFFSFNVSIIRLTKPFFLLVFGRKEYMHN